MSSSDVQDCNCTYDITLKRLFRHDGYMGSDTFSTANSWSLEATDVHEDGSKTLHYRLVWHTPAPDDTSTGVTDSSMEGISLPSPPHQQDTDDTPR